MSVPGGGGGLGDGERLGAVERTGLGERFGLAEVRTTTTCTADALADADGLAEALVDGGLVDISTCIGELLSTVTTSVGDWLGDAMSAAVLGDISFSAE